MRITTTTVDSFLANASSAVSIFNDTIYVERSRHPLNGKTARDASSFQVFFQLSAVVDFKSGGQGLLVCGVDCGIDRTSQDGGLDGSAVMEQLAKEVVDFCINHKLEMLPGVLDQ